MRIRRAQLSGMGGFNDWYCSLFGEIYDASAGQCTKVLTPSYTTRPGLPSGYPSTTPTGAIPTNPTGETQVLIPTTDGGVVSSDVLAQAAADNAANAAACKARGGTWDAENGVCDTTNKILLMLGLGIGAIFLLMAVKR
jgi:hypothetical protein